MGYVKDVSDKWKKIKVLVFLSFHSHWAGIMTALTFPAPFVSAVMSENKNVQQNKEKTKKEKKKRDKSLKVFYLHVQSLWTDLVFDFITFS